jgi:hypothetical protein
MHIHVHVTPIVRRHAATLLALIATCLPILNILHIITTTGVDVLSSDYVFHVQAMTRILSPGYAWTNLLSDAFYNGHLMFFPLLLRIVLARFFYWNTYLELFIGVGASVLMLCALHNAMTARMKARHPLRVWLWPLLSALIFSIAQINQYTFGDAAVPMGFTALGLSLTLWSLVRYGTRWRGVALAMLSAWFASGSWGQGIIAWPLLLAAMLSVNVYARWATKTAPVQRHAHANVYSLKQFVIVGVAAAIALAPYALLRTTAPGSHHALPLALLNLKFIVNGIGFAFINGLDYTFDPTLRVLLSMLGVEALAVCLVLLLRARQQVLWRRAAPALFVIAAGVGSLWLVSIFRPGLSIWYTGIGALFWIGLAGLAYTLYTSEHTLMNVRAYSSTYTRRMNTRWLRVVGAIVLSGIAVIYLLANRSYEDKTYFLYTRAPVTVSCLRALDAAPAACMPFVILDSSGSPEPAHRFAAQLQALNVSVFAPHQQWTLQGDFSLDNVKAAPIAEVKWLQADTAQPRPATDFRHLNLLLPPGSTVEWTLHVPPNVQQATLRTAVSLSPAQVISDTAELTLRTPDGAPARLWSAPPHSSTGWQPAELSLLPYAGQTITLQFRAGAGNAVLWRYPQVDVDLAPPAVLQARTP